MYYGWRVRVMRTWLHRLVDILSMLERPPEKGCVWELNTSLPTESTALKTAIRCLRESAKCCCESFAFLRAGVRCLGCWLQNLSSSLHVRFLEQVHIFVARQSRKQIERSSQGLDSCLQSDAKKKLVSSDENKRVL
jgi:hypothetical protein